MGFSNYPAKYIRFNNQSAKNLNVVVEIEGAPEPLSLVTIYNRIRYGDPGIVYGGPGLIYGGLVKANNFKSYLSIKSNLTIGQKIEPEQGRASVSLMTLTFVDVNGYMTNLVTPGKVVDEILGNKLVKVKLGYQQTSYPEDYFTVFRGYVSNITTLPTELTLQLSDANSKKRQQLFFTPKPKLSFALAASLGDTVVTVPTTDKSYQQILGPDGTYDTSVKTYIKIDDEVMEYGPTDITPTTYTVDRAQRGTGLQAHGIGSDIDNTIQLEGNLIDLALKLMLSGWNGPWISDVAVQSIGNTLSPLGIQPRTILMPDKIDVVDDYGLTPGDQVIISGSGAGNDGTYTLIKIATVNDRKNNLIYVDADLNTEFPTTATLSFRSKYDTFPVNCGLKMKPSEVDVETYETLKNQFFSQAENIFNFYQTDVTTGKEFIDSQLMLPVGAYSITRYGRVSMTTTKPPIADDKLPEVSKDSVVEPTSMSTQRGINNRRYYNEIQYSYDEDDAGSFRTVDSLVDEQSLVAIAISVPLPIPARGIKSTQFAAILIKRRGQFLLNRFKNAAVSVKLKVNWRVGSIIEAGDVVLLRDEGNLHLNNFDNGTRDLGVQLFEVINREMDIKTGTVTLELLSNIGYQVNDRFATISPSSVVDAGSTVNSIKIKDSFGALYPGNEKKKWEQLVNNPLVIHDYNWTTVYTTMLTGFDPGDDYKMIVDPPMAAAPPSDFIVDIDFYPNTTLATDDQLYKLLFAHLTPTVDVATGVSQFAFTVPPGEETKFTPGLPVMVHSLDYSVMSPESIVDSVVGTQINVKQDLGFTPAAGQFVDLIGYIDGGGPYRVL